MITGPCINEYLKALPHASHLADDRKMKLTSYRLDTGAEVAFDPKTSTKGSVYIDKVPIRLCSSGEFGKVAYYQNGTLSKPSTALERVSKYLDSQPQVYKVDVKTLEGLEKLIEWVRWA